MGARGSLRVEGPRFKGTEGRTPIPDRPARIFRFLGRRLFGAARRDRLTAHLTAMSPLPLRRAAHPPHAAAERKAPDMGGYPDEENGIPAWCRPAAGLRRPDGPGA